MTELPQQFQGEACGAAQNAASARDDRRKRPSEAYTPPFSIRLSFDERAKLEAAAAGQPLGAFIRETIFGSDIQPRRTRDKNPVADHQALAQVLAALGASRLSSNLNQLAHSANIGALPVLPETEEALQAACQDIRQMRRMLMIALGYQGEDTSDTDHAIPELEP